jgi:oligopeptide/dipeptide ABC transporter ATP-binding protein
MIAIAVALGPTVLIADEPTTALEVTIQAQIMDLLRDLRRETGMGLVLITHDLGVVAENAERVAVMYAGRIVESAPLRNVFRRPAHPYTIALMRSVPSGERRDARLRPVRGAPPDLARIPTGCPFHPRCELAIDRCRVELPPVAQVEPGHLSACHRIDDVESLRR